MKEAQELTKAIAKKHGGGEMIFAKDEEESKELWSIRKNAHWSMLALVEGGQAYSTGKPTSKSDWSSRFRRIQRRLKDLGRFILSRRLRAGLQAATTVCGDTSRPESERNRGTAPGVRLSPSSLSLFATATILT